MTNQEIQSAWHYHNGTKHPDGFLMDRWHSFDPMNHPLLFKIYSALKSIPLTIDTPPTPVPSLSGTSANLAPPAEHRPLDIDALARILHYSAGITKTIRYSWGEMAFRAAACTGALYHIELYLVCADLRGLPAGVYHYDPGANALEQLRQGDYKAALVEASGGESGISSAPATIIYTDVFWRNACKYQAREYRHSYWDSGTILANTLAVSSAHNIPAKVVLGFVDESVNLLLDLDTQREVALALLPLGQSGNPVVGTTQMEVVPLGLKTEPISRRETEFPAILDLHRASSFSSATEVVSWRAAAPTDQEPKSSVNLIPLDTHLDDEMFGDPIEEVIARRGSARRFSSEALTFRQLSSILERASQGIPADFINSTGPKFNQIYLIVNAVDELISGSYVFHQDLNGLELLEEGDFRYQAGILGLHQDLPANASVNLYFLSGLAEVLERLGNRGYRAAQLEASIAAGKIYLAAYAQGLAATGLTFYDDAVTEFFSPHARNKSVMFLVAVGKKAARS